MSGGGSERVAASYTTNLNESGVSDKYGDYFGTKAHPPYVNTYNIDNMKSCTFATCGGQALYETSNGRTVRWRGSNGRFVRSRHPWFHRGGSFYDDDSPYGSGLASIFHTNRDRGRTDSGSAFRVALVPALQD